MKTNKLWSIIMMIVFVLGTAVTLSSCSSDDNNDNNDQTPTTPSIYGTWKTDGGSAMNTKTGTGSKFYRYYTINKDGTLVKYHETEHWEDFKVTGTEKSSYSHSDYIYDTTTGRLFFKMDGYSYSFIVYIGEKTMSWMYSDGDVWILERQ